MCSVSIMFSFLVYYVCLLGVPLPLVGMVAYGLVATLGLQLPAKKLPFGIEESNGHLVLLGCTTSMAVASGYFLYVLSTRLSGTFCSYCFLSAFMSFSLFFIILKARFFIIVFHS